MYFVPGLRRLVSLVVVDRGHEGYMTILQNSSKFRSCDDSSEDVTSRDFSVPPTFRLHHALSQSVRYVCLQDRVRSSSAN